MPGALELGLVAVLFLGLQVLMQRVVVQQVMDRWSS